MSERPNEHARTANFEFDALRAAENYRRALVREFTPHLQGRVIEIGAGIGQITGLLRKLPAVEHLLAIEPDAGFCREFRQAFPDQPLLAGTIDSLTDPGPWHGVVSINVLEHIREDERELADYARLLRPEKGRLKVGRDTPCAPGLVSDTSGAHGVTRPPHPGRLCLFVPARQEIYAPIDKDFGHHRRYAKAELKRKLESAGFEIVRLNYFNCIGYFAWWLNFRIMKKRGFDVGSVRFFDRAIFPFVYWCESHVCPPPFGQSLIAVARAK
ncbi:MAG: class I SAM-dependent methyltransferase [Verrucomicrobia bacterium]|jgi:SAM-dependent methyltransferase|nr:class I SAM-dependent methyltransferase [Verrucomicrobiota bacterium]